MKTQLAFGVVFILGLSPAFSQVVVTRVTDAPVVHKHTHEGAIAAANAAASADLSEKQKYFIPRDPWRVITNRWQDTEHGHQLASGAWTNYAKGEEWLQFSGKVLEVTSNQILLKGWYGSPLDFEHGVKDMNFEVKNFPYPVRPGVELPAGANYSAHLMMLHAVYPGDSATAATLDYGKVTQPPGKIKPRT